MFPQEKIPVLSDEGALAGTISRADIERALRLGSRPGEAPSRTTPDYVPRRSGRRRPF